jgi:hypothetical protein
VHPGYGLAAHKGYATPEHRRSLVALGPCALHRRSFAPVRALISGELAQVGLPFDETALDDPIFDNEMLSLEDVGHCGEEFEGECDAGVTLGTEMNSA